MLTRATNQRVLTSSTRGRLATTVAAAAAAAASPSPSRLALQSTGASIRVRLVRPSAHSHRTMATAGATTLATMVCPEFDPSIHHLAVYGSLRDDDDSQQPWTQEFVNGLGEARDGVVEGATIYHDLVAGYPKVIFDANVNESQAKAAAETGTSEAAAIAASSTTATASAAASLPSSSSGLPNFVHVRLLSWATRADFEAKMRAADVIEGYNPADEAGSEYVRRSVWVRTVDPLTGKVERIRSWMYVMVEAMKPDASWVRIPAQDWMKRDRALKKAS